MQIHPEHTWGHTLPFGEVYYQNAVKLLREIRDDAAIMAEVAAKAADAIRAGNKVYANITTGHMPTYELVNDREGNPAQFEFTGADTCTPEQFAAMRAGDVYRNQRQSAHQPRQRSGTRCPRCRCIRCRVHYLLRQQPRHAAG